MLRHSYRPLIRAVLLGAIAFVSLCFAVARPSLAEEQAPQLDAGEAEPAVPFDPSDPVDAADVAAEEARGTSGAADEIVVTRARRREESLQSVPIPIAALSGDFLDKTGTWNIPRLVQLEPSLQLFSSNPRNTGINIRGIGAPFGLTNDGIEPGVGLYVDDVFYARPASSVFDFVDIESIEILRGPQGTLYGKNTTAGAINLRTRAPSFEPEATAELSVGNYMFVQGKTSLSGPLIADKLAGRFSLTTTHRDGTVYNVANDVDVNDQNQIGMRGQLLWLATDDLKVNLYGDYNQQRLECCTQVIARVAPTKRNPNRQFFGIIADLDYTPPSMNGFDRLTDVDSPLRANTNLGGASANIDWNVGGGTLTSITAWRFWDWNPSNDRDFLGIPVTTLSQNPSQQDQWTQEIRYNAGATLPELASWLGRDIDYVGGLFAFYQTLDSQGSQMQGADATRYLLPPSPNTPLNLLDGLRAADDISLNTASVAIFGQATWHITEKLSLTPGLRLNYDAKDGSFDRAVSGGLETDDPALIALKNSILSPQSYDVDFSDFNASGQLTPAYQFTDDVFGFFTWAHGFKSGGINIAGLPTRPDGTPALELAEIDPEQVNHYELGVKTTLFDGMATANLTLYRSDVSDYQTQVVNAQLGVLRGYLANAEKVRVQGIETEIAARPRDDIDLYTNLAFNDAEYIDFPDAPCPIEETGGEPFCDISGQGLPGAPKWALSYGGEYRLPANFSVFKGEAYLGVDASYQSAFSSNPSPSAYMKVPGRSLVNFRGGYRADNGWEIWGWARNAFDTDYYEFLSPQPGNSGLIVGQLGDPVTFGLTMRVKF